MEPTRARNRSGLLDLIHQNGGITVADLVTQSTLSRATVSEILRDLEREGLIERAAGHSTSDSRGRPPALIVPSAPARLTISIDVGHFRMRGALFAHDGEILEMLEPESHVLEDLTFKSVLDRVEVTIDKLLRGTQSRIEEIRGIAVSIPPPIHRSGTLANRESFENWPRFPALRIGESVKSRFGPVRVLVENDVNVCLLGERYRGAAEASDIVFVKATTGFGCAFLSNGELHRGHNGIAGEIGHMIVTDNIDRGLRPECKTCGHFACLKNVASSDAIVANVVRKKSEKGNGESEMVLGISEIIDLALKNDDPECMTALEEAGRFLGMAIRHLVQQWDPDLVLLGGVLSKAGDILLDEISGEMIEDARRFPKRNPTIQAVKDYEMSALYGGYALIRHEHTASPLPAD